MLYLCGRWEEFWHQPGLHYKLVEVFSTKPEPAERLSDLAEKATDEGLDAAA
jgi:hypothetical protein